MEKKFVPATRADVARLADVSETIVSYVMNGNRYVNQEKRLRVEKAIQELNYQPNNVARALKGKRSNNILFIADQITNEHFSRLIGEMDQYSYEKGYMISLCANRNSEAFVSKIISRRYDGIVISSISFPESYIRRLVAARIPVVVLKNRNYTDIEDVGMINTGLYFGARECVRYLAGLGCRKILYIDRFSTKNHFSTMDDLRYCGFVEQMLELGLPFSCDNVITGCHDANEVSWKVRRRIEEGFVPDAIFGRNDRLSCIAMQMVKRLGYHVPADIAVIGFDNSSLSQYVTPTLTTVEIRRDEIGKQAIEMLHQMITQGTIPPPAHIPTKLILRESTDRDGHPAD